MNNHVISNLLIKSHKLSIEAEISSDRTRRPLIAHGADRERPNVYPEFTGPFLHATLERFFISPMPHTQLLSVFCKTMNRSSTIFVTLSRSSSFA